MNYKTSILFISSVMLLVSLSSCDYTRVKNDEIISSKILTKEEQAALTPGKVIEDLKLGNQEFVEDNFTIRNTSDRVKEAISGQYPEAVILSCIDSRVPVEDIFQKGIGDLFVARIAGNIVDDEIIGSLEYSCKVSGAKLVVVLGHEYCGAIKSSIEGIKLGYITTILERIEPAIKEAKENYKGEHTVKNPQFVDQVCYYNVIHSINQIREKSVLLDEMEQKGEIMIVGAIYDMKTGKVDFI